MAKKRFASLVQDRPVAKNAKHIPDRDIDFSDIPDSTRIELKGAKRVGRPAGENSKHLIAIRIDPRLLLSLRKLAAKLDKPYQTLIHELLMKATKDAA